MGPKPIREIYLIFGLIFGRTPKIIPSSDFICLKFNLFGSHKKFNTSNLSFQGFLNLSRGNLFGAKQHFLSYFINKRAQNDWICSNEEAKVQWEKITRFSDSLPFYHFSASAADNNVVGLLPAGLSMCRWCWSSVSVVPTLITGNSPNSAEPDATAASDSRFQRSETWPVCHWHLST